MNLNWYRPHLPKLPAVTRHLSAVLMLSVAGAVLLGALVVAVCTPEHGRDDQPEIIVSDDHPAMVRGDRLSRLMPAVPTADFQSRFEQLDASGHLGETYIRTRTHLVAPAGAAEPTSLVSNYASDSVVESSSLPSEILHGASRAIDVGGLAASVPRGNAVNLTVLPEKAPSLPEAHDVIVAKRGNTLEDILRSLHLAGRDVDTIAAEIRTRWRSCPHAFVGGEVIDVARDPRPGLVTQPLSITATCSTGSAATVVRTDSGGYVTIAADSQQPRAQRPQTGRVRLKRDPRHGLSMRDSLIRFARAKGLQSLISGDLLRRCAEEIDLDAVASADDTIDIMTREAGGQRELVFLSIAQRGRTHRFYKFTPPGDRSADFYNGDGQAMTQMLSTRPLSNGRLGDGFGWRIHPVLHDHRFHEGVDFAAPMHSPIVATGAGVVEKIDQESGYGKYVRLRHDFGYATTYAHIAEVRAGLKVGDRLQQGDVIAYVGSTGLSTGPHLYYELEVDGRRVDPLQAHLPAQRVLAGSDRMAFDHARTQIDQLLAASHRAD